MEVLRSILEGSLSKDQRQRAKAKLQANYPPYSVERSRLNNADKYINEQVYKNEIKQSNAYDSGVPVPSDFEEQAHIGKVYKIEAYANPFVASLRGKLQLYQQLTTAIEFAMATVKMGRESSTGEAIYGKRMGIIPDILKSNYFGTKEVLTEYNDMMIYITNYADEVKKNTFLGDTVFQNIMAPILTTLSQVISSYASFFNILPKYNNDPQKAVFNAVKTLIEKNYVLYSTMYELIQNRIYTPLTDSDIENFKQKYDVEQLILKNTPRTLPSPAPIAPLPPTGSDIQPSIPAQPVPQPVAPPIPRISQIKDVDPAILAQFQPPANIRNTSGQTISAKDYFYLLGFRWTEREDEFLRQQISRYEQGIAREKGEKQTFERRLAEIQAQGQRRTVEGELLQRISELTGSIRQNEEQVKQLKARRLKLLKAYELLAEYLREVAKLPTDEDGNFDVEVRKIRQEDLRTLANNEQAFKDSVGLIGFGLSGGQAPNEIKDHIPIHTSEFEMKRRMKDRARGDPRIVEPDQNIATRMRMFDPITEFDPKFELLKRGFKANDSVMEPDRGMKILPVVGQYEASGFADDENETAFKQRFGLPYSQHAKRTDDKPIQVEYKRPFGGFYDIDDNDEFNTVKNFEELYKPVEHFKVEEEPDDILDHPDEFKRKIESYRFNTGRMKTKPVFMK